MGNRDIIVIGGSSEAKAPLKEILRDIPADLPAAVFVVLPISPHGIGILSTVVSAVGQLPVAEALANEQEGKIDEALRVALRIIEERAELVHRMAEDGRQGGRRWPVCMVPA